MDIREKCYERATEFVIEYGFTNVSEHIMESPQAIALILLTLLSTLNRQATFFLKDLKHALTNPLGLLENIMTKLRKLNLIKLLQYTQVTQNVRHGKDIT